MSRDFASEISIFSDGASRWNGHYGLGAWACKIFRDFNCGPKQGSCTYYSNSGCLGYGYTNNQAEYHGIIAGLELAISYEFENFHGVKLFTDSEIIAKQLNGEYRVRESHLIPLYNRAIELINQFYDLSIDWATRNSQRIEECDQLANEEIETYLKKCFESESASEQSKTVKFCF